MSNLFTHIARRRGLVITGAIISAAAIAVGSGFAISSSGHSNKAVIPISYSKQSSSNALVPTTDPAQAISGVMGRYDGRGVVSVGIANQPQIPGARPGTYLHFVLAVPSDDESVIRSEWEADLIQGAIADSLALSGGVPVVGSIMDWELPGGKVLRDRGGGMGDITPGQVFDAPTDAAVEEELSEGLKAAGLKLMSLNILHVDQPAPAIVAETADRNTAASAASETVRALFGQAPPKYEGYYFEVRDSSGKRVFIQSASFRTGAGHLWISPDVASVSSLQHG